MFVVQFKYGQASLVSVNVKKETKARYYVGEKPTVILGRNFLYSTFIAKNATDTAVFSTGREALDFLIAEVAGRRAELLDTTNKLRAMEDILVALRAAEGFHD